MLDRLSADTLFDLLPEPAFIFRQNGNVMAANVQALELFEIKGVLGNLNVADLLPEPERARLDPITWMARWADEPNAPELEYVYLTCRTMTGEERLLRVRVSRVVTDDTFYLALLHDITNEQNRMREERDAHRIAARALAISADAMVTTDGGFLVTGINRAAAELFGYGEEELVGAPLGRLLPERLRRVHGDHMRRFAAETAPSRLMGDRSPVLGLCKDGTEIPLDASITKVTIAGSVHFCAIIRDRSGRESPSDVKG